MYRELKPFREALSQELKASLFPAVAGVDPNKLLETYLDRLTMYTGVDVADQTFTVLAMDAGQETLGSLEGCANDPDGFQRFVIWARDLRNQHDLRIIAVAGETTGIYYWALWDFLGEQPDIARVLYNPRTTKHMGEVLSKKVRNELVDALLLAEQLRLNMLMLSLVDHWKFGEMFPEDLLHILLNWNLETVFRSPDQSQIHI